MKGLLQKDLYMLWSYSRSFLLIVALFLVVGGMSRDNAWFLLYPMLIGVMLPINLQGYDEKFHWDRSCDTMPVTRAQVVSAKYLLVLGSVLTLFLLSLLAMLLSGGRENLAELCTLLLGIGLIGPSLLFPVIFRWGLQKGRIAYYIIVAVIIGGTSFVMTGEPLNVSAPTPALTLAVCALLFAASWLVSVKLYETREL